MSNPLSPANLADAALSVTRPLYLVFIALASPLYLSTREQVSYKGETWAAAGLKVDLDGERLTLFNADLAYTAAMFSGISGVEAEIYRLYGDAPFTAGDADRVFKGFVGGVPKIGAQIVIELEAVGPRKVPRHVVAPPVFNHLPPEGLQILTPTGVYVLRGR